MSTIAPCRVDNPGAFGRVALLLGGDSAEREVSLKGGADVSASLARSGVAHTVCDGAPALFDAIRRGEVDRVFNLMHGPGGEDGAIQGALSLMHVPITGSDLLGSALSMDKVRSKWVWERLGIPTAPFRVIEAGDSDFLDVGQDLELPLFVKPTGLGSSIGITRVTDRDELAPAVAEARRYSDTVVVEQGVAGREYFVGILGEATLPLIGIETPNAFYDYEAKYLSDTTRYHCPSGLPADQERDLGAQALAAFEALHCSGWGRVDFILDDDGKAWFLEVNTAPGMTDHSLVPQAAAVIGVDFDELVWRILETSL
ncbi:MAG: D-alanine--D-alanine ligase [Xanthomonadales bacterium]|jgi:D-alanine-D-alanine ligase|nr:D-alanine--D-alanine ligase [Xanthomonadales bacterium]